LDNFNSANNQNVGSSYPKTPTLQAIQLCTQVLNQSSTEQGLKDLVTLSQSMESIVQIFQSASVEAETAEQAQTDIALRRRWVAITLKHAKQQGINISSLATLKDMTLHELRGYISQNFPELVSRL
jgi:ribosome-interacting GTPase 1